MRSVTLTTPLGGTARCESGRDRLGGVLIASGRFPVNRCPRSETHTPRRALITRPWGRGVSETILLSATPENWFWPTLRDRIDHCWSGGVEDAFAEQVEVGAAVHLSLDHFDAVDVALYCA